MRRITAVTLLVFLCGITGGSARPAAAPAPLVTAAECESYAVDDKVEICHATGSARKPYQSQVVSVSSCINGHGGHLSDFVAPIDGCGGVQ